jgi:hypothetical protein
VVSSARIDSEIPNAAGTPAPSRARAARQFKSLLVAAPAIVLLAIVVADARQSADPDLWGHLIAGREILAHGTLPDHNPYSYSAPDYLWLHHEWLSELAMGWAYGWFGIAGLKLLKLACVAATISFTAAAMGEAGALIGVQAMMLITVALVFAPMMQTRPQLFDYMGLSVVIWMLQRHRARADTALWPIIPITALWANLHGGFFLAPFALGIYGAVTATEDLAHGVGIKRGARIIAIAIAALAASAITFAIPLARETWHTLILSVRNPLTSGNISDWRPTLAVAVESFSHGGPPAFFYATVLAMLAAGIVAPLLTPRAIQLPNLAVAAAMFVLALTATRNDSLAAIALAPLIARHVSALIASDDAAAARKMPIAMQFPVAIAALFFGFNTRVVTGPIDASDYPRHAIDFMNSHHLRGNVLADFGWGATVIYDLPGSLDFIDGRYDLAFPPSVFIDWLDFQEATPAAAAMLDRYPHQYALLHPDMPGTRLIAARSDWRLIYSDPLAVLYVHRGAFGFDDPAGPPVTAPRATAEFP